MLSLHRVIEPIVNGTPKERAMSIPELSIQIKNVPGQLVQVTSVLAEAGVNIRGIAASGTTKAGWVHMIVDNSKLAEEALDECGFQVDTGEALAVVLPNEPGHLDRALRVLSDNKINLDYVYTCAEQPKARVLAVLGVQSPGKVEKLLTAHGVEVVK
jgi:hypothetical protein